MNSSKFWLEAEDYLNTIERILPDIDKALTTRATPKLRRACTRSKARWRRRFSPCRAPRIVWKTVLDELYETVDRDTAGQRPLIGDL